MTERLVTREAPAGLDDDERPTINREHLLALFGTVRRNARFDEGQELDVLDAFERLLPGEPALTERRAELLAQAGAEQDAYRLLRRLDSDLLSDDARFLLFRLALRHDPGVSHAQEIASLGLTDEGRFERFVAELKRLNPPARDRDPASAAIAHRRATAHCRRLVRRTHGVAGRARKRRRNDLSHLRQRGLGVRVPQRTLAGAPAERPRRTRQADGARRADGGHERHGPARRRPDPPPVQPHRGRPGVDEAVAGARGRLRHLNRAARDRLAHRVADRLLAKSRAAEAAMLLADLAHAAADTGDVQSASEAVERAIGVWTGVDGAAPLPQWLARARDRVQDAWSEMTGVVEWRQDAEALQAEKLRERYRNRRILIAGGLVQHDWKRRLEEDTGAAIDWAEHFKAEGADLDAYAERIRNGHYDVVVFYVQKSAHEVQHRLRPAAEGAGIPFVSTPSAGLRGFIEALASAAESLASSEPDARVFQL